jgi:hypothetical protein
METVTLTVKIDSERKNGKIQSFAWSSKPVLHISTGDMLAVAVDDAGSASTMKLRATITSSQAKGVPPGQAASPFTRTNGDVQTYFDMALKQKPWTFDFPRASILGKYELTFVLETDKGTEFSDDPEFDVEP